MNPPLLPCPFCGSDAELKSTRDLTDHWVKCPTCFVDIGRNSTCVYEAAAAWNRRAPVEPASSDQITSAVSQWQVKESEDNKYIFEAEYFDWAARVKWDGCIDLSQAGESVHICEVDNAILMLQSLKEVAKKHFGEQWNE